MAAAAKVLDDDGNDDKGTPPCIALTLNSGKLVLFFPRCLSRAFDATCISTGVEIRQKGSEGWKLANHKSVLGF